MSFLKNLGLFILALSFIFLLMHGLTKLSCLNERPGTMVVIGGNSFRCR